LEQGQAQLANHQHPHRRQYGNHHQRRHQQQLNIQLTEFFAQASHLAEQLA
jgi:hypothetical protein